MLNNSSTKGLFSEEVSKSDYVPKPTLGQRHVRDGPIGVGATTTEIPQDDETVFLKGEVVIHGEGISRETEDINLLKLKNLSRLLAHKEGKKGIGPHHGTPAAIAASAFNTYLTAIAQERLENPADINRELTYLDTNDVDLIDLINRLKEEVKLRQRVETKLIGGEIVRGGVAAHVQSATDKLESLLTMIE